MSQKFCPHHPIPELYLIPKKLSGKFFDLLLCELRATCALKNTTWRPRLCVMLFSPELAEGMVYLFSTPPLFKTKKWEANELRMRKECANEKTRNN